MGRYRSPSRSYSPSPRSRTPPPRQRFDPPRDGNRRYQPRRDFRRSSPPSGLLVRNISLDARPEDLRIPFQRYGPIRDVYLPKNYYTGEPRGFGFVKFRNADDAAEAKYQLNHTKIGGREIAIVFADENRRTHNEMRTTRPSGRYGASRRRESPARSPMHQHRSYSRSRSPVRHDSRDKNRRVKDYYSPSRSRSLSRSVSPGRERDHRVNHKPLSSKDNDRSPMGNCRSPSPLMNGQKHREIRNGGSDQRIHSHSRSALRSPARSYSPS